MHRFTPLKTAPAFSGFPPSLAVTLRSGLRRLIEGAPPRLELLDRGGLDTVNAEVGAVELLFLTQTQAG